MLQVMGIAQVLADRRRELGMTLDDVVRRSGISVSTVKRLFTGEHDVGISAVVAIADALGMDLSARRRIPSDRMRQKQARKKAERLVSMVQATSAMESQGVGEQSLRLMVQQTAAALLQASRSTLWAEI